MAIVQRIGSGNFISWPLSGNVNRISITQGDGSLQDVVSSCVFDLDASQSASYGGSGDTWANLVTSPADGSAQTAYDVTRSGGTKPVWDGSNLRFTTNGIGYFEIAANTTWIESLHRAAASPYSWIATLSLPSSASNNGLFATGGNSLRGVGTLLQPQTATPRYAVYQNNGSTNNLLANNAVNSNASAQTLCIGFSWTGDGTYITWKNGSQVATGTYSRSAGTDGNAGAKLVICANISSGGIPDSLMPSSGWIKSFAMFQSAVSSSQFNALQSKLEARHGTTY